VAHFRASIPLILSTSLPTTKSVRIRNAKLHEETITPAEREEFLQLTDQIEQADAERLRHLIALAQVRQVSVDTLMDQLGIRRPPVHA
jgi:hypothetical protein